MRMHACVYIYVEYMMSIVWYSMCTYVPAFIHVYSHSDMHIEQQR